MRRLGTLVFLVASVALLCVSQQAWAGAVISNGTVQLGVDDAGQLNFDTGAEGIRGVTYVPTGNDGTRAGCLCEGWGAGSGTPAASGVANNDNGVTVAPVSFTATATTATSVADVAATAPTATSAAGVGTTLRVTHEYVPSPSTPNLYEVKITLENVSGGPLQDLRYERIMDWDVEPTAFSEFVTIQRGSTPAPAGNLIYSDDNGFSDNDPFTGDGPIDATTVNADYTDKGPADHGARFTFGFGDLLDFGGS